MSDKYIQNMTTEEKLAFFKIFCKMIKADNNIDAGELDFLKEKAAKFGIDNATVVSIVKSANSVNAEAEAGKIKDRQSALELIKELCVLANVDDDLSDAELDLIISIAHAMDVEDEKIILINRWVLDSIIVAKTGDIILEKNNE